MIMMMMILTILMMIIMILMMMIIIINDDNYLGLIGEQGGETERRGPGRDPAGEGGN